jgi:hypothetical protein
VPAGVAGLDQQVAHIRGTDRELVEVLLDMADRDSYGITVCCRLDTAADFTGGWCCERSARDHEDRGGGDD